MLRTLSRVSELPIIVKQLQKVRNPNPALHPLTFLIVVTKNAIEQIHSIMKTLKALP